ncbi:hypothetical protein D3C80_1641570 [compost metagenome]
MIAAQTQRFAQRHFKYGGNFLFTRMIMKIGRNNPHDGCNLKSGDAINGRQHANNFNHFRWNGDFFVSLSQRGSNQRRVC